MVSSDRLAVCEKTLGVFHTTKEGCVVNAINVCMPGHIDPYDSYSLLAIELARGMTRQGVYVNLFSMGERQRDTQDPETVAIVNQPIRPSLGAIFLGYPTGYRDHENSLTQHGPQVSICMFESSKIHPEWVEILNQMDAVIVPSQFCLDVFKSCGVTSPIHVIPLGISKTYQPYERPLDREPFTFLAWMDRGKRKGGFHAIQAFSLAFGDDPSVRLVLKARDNVTGFNVLNDNIELVARDMTEAELYELYKSADCLVNPNLGEGFGLVPREFAATGGVSLATNWSGTADDLPLWGWPIPYSLKPADWRGIAKFQGVDLGDWADPDIPALAGIMRDVVDNYETYHHMALLQAPDIHKMYSWRTFTTAVYDVFKEVANARYIVAAS